MSQPDHIEAEEQVVLNLKREQQNEELAGSPAKPIAVIDRLPSLDVLRGFALLGILLANILDFAAPGGKLHDIPLEVVARSGPHHALDVAVMTGQWFFVEGKMRALFGLLFGAGTVLLLDRLERRSGAAVAADIFHRRNMWLLLFGLIHGTLIWMGDILLFYSSLALLTLYPLRRVQGKRLVWIGLAISLSGGTLGIANAMNLQIALPSAALLEGAAAARVQHKQPTEGQEKAVAAAANQRAEELKEYTQKIAIVRGGYLASEPDNARDHTAFVTLIVSSGWVLEVLGIMIAGMGLYRIGFLSASLPSRVYFGTALAGYTVAISIVLIGLEHSRRFGFSDAVTTLWMFLPYGFQQIAGALANASVLLLLVRHGKLLPLQRGLAAVGRTALSNYIFTSLACQFLFKWGPWKLYGSLEYYQQIYVVIVVWVGNIVLSLFWLRYFKFGPLEWLWRSLTYWHPQPMVVKRLA